MVAAYWAAMGTVDSLTLTLQRRSLAKHAALRVVVGGHHTRLIPDAMFLFRHTGGGMACCFVEMDNGSMNEQQIREKYARYLAWSQSAGGKQYLLNLYRSHGAKEPRPMFRLLVIAHGRTGHDDQQRMGELSVPIFKLPATMRDRFWFTTVGDLCRWQHHPLPLDAAICAEAGMYRAPRTHLPPIDRTRPN